MGGGCPHAATMRAGMNAALKRTRPHARIGAAGGASSAHASEGAPER